MTIVKSKLKKSLQTPLIRVGYLSVFAGVTGIGMYQPMSAIAANPEVSGMEEIIVSARRRDESLQDIPDQVTVFDSQAIEDAGINSMVDVSRLSPGVFYTGDRAPGVSTLTVRGITQNPNSDAPVAFVVDGVTLGNTLLIGQPMFDVQQIEVLKGPQGALYGRNSIGGAVNIVTKRPTNETEAKIKVRGAKGNDYQIQAMLSGALADDVLLGRLSVLYEDLDGGLHENRAAGEDPDFREGTTIRGKLIWNASDALTVDLRGAFGDIDHSSVRWDAVQGANNPGDTDLAVPFAPPAGTPEAAAFTPADPLNPAGPGVLDLPDSGPGSIADTGSTSFLTEGETEFTELSVKIDFDAGFATITNTLGYSDFQVPFETDLDGTPFNFLNAKVDPEDSEIITEEFRVTSADDVALRWIVGGFYQNQERSRTINGWFWTEPEGDEQFQALNSDFENTAIALFGQVNYDITDNLELTVAARWDEDERKVTDNLAAGATFEETFDEFQPKVSLAYTLENGTLTYFTYAKGFRSGGFNGSGFFGNPNDGFGGRLYEAETVDNYEIGFKMEFERTRVSGALFMQDYNDQQFFAFTPTAGQNIINAEESEIFGLELELHSSLTDNLEFSMGLAYTDTEILEFGNLTETVGGVTTVVLTNEEIQGNEFLYVPDFTFNASLQHSMPINDAVNLISRVDLTRTGDTFWGFDNQEKQDAYNLVNVRLGLESENWRITAFANNVADKEYQSWEWINRFIGTQYNLRHNGDPVSYGVELEYSFF